MVERTKHIEKGLVLMGKEKREDKRGFELEGAQSQCRRGDTWLELGKHKKKDECKGYCKPCCCWEGSADKESQLTLPGGGSRQFKKNTTS